MYRLAFSIGIIWAPLIFAEDVIPRRHLFGLPSSWPLERKMEYLKRIRPLRHVPTPAELDERFEKDRIYKGTRIELRPNVDKTAFAEVISAFAAAFVEADPCPKGRLQEFDFLQVLMSKDIAIVGWDGYVTGITRQRDGKHVIVIDVRPKMVGRGGGYIFTPKVCTEHWEWDGEMPRFIKMGLSKGLEAILTL